ncbi:MAG: hypothetical protein LBN31_05980 [Hungatella sp.]|nr:hypothetical protein [Hungatella sp.]
MLQEDGKIIVTGSIKGYGTAMVNELERTFKLYADYEYYFNKENKEDY